MLTTIVFILVVASCEDARLSVPYYFALMILGVTISCSALGYLTLAPNVKHWGVGEKKHWEVA